MEGVADLRAFRVAADNGREGHNMDNLDNFLKGDETPEVTETPETPEVAETPETPAEPVEAKPETAERPRGPDGKFIPKGETAPETPAAASPAAEEPQLDHAALIGERRRRQEAEDRLREMERLLSERLNQPAAPTAIPDQWEDPDGYARWMQSEAVSKAVEAARAEAYQTFQTQRIAVSAEEAKAKLPDYAEKMQVFEQMLQGNQQLLQELYRAPNPAEYAYNTAKTQMEITQYGSLDALIAARVQEALQAQVPAAPAPQPPIPETLAGEQSARSAAAPTLNVPTLDAILGRKG